MKKPAVLLILDGFGLAPDGEANAISLARTPVLDALFARCPHSQLSASGLDVGLPAGQMGNSEVGHTNIGAGRVIFQDLPKISQAIETGTFFENKAYAAAMDAAAQGHHALHIIGLLSDGGVHSHNTHLYALLKMAKLRGVEKCFVHALLDGRDVGPTTGISYVEELCAKMRELDYGSVATLQGRFYGMDRDKRYERVEQGYNAIVCGEGAEADDPVQAVQDSYDKGVTDEFMLPTVCDKSGMIQSGDSVIFLNFRPDRARELSHAHTDEEFDGFVRKKGYFPLHYVCTTEYDSTLRNVSIAFPPEDIEETFGQVLAEQGLTQLRIAETEKYAHVTFFFNGGREEPYSGEDRCLIPSPRDFATYDLVPEMSAYQVAEECAARIRSGKYDAVICNLANCDMVGHTAVREAVIKAVETVDECVGTIVRAVEEVGGTALITADHGNADRIVAPDGSPDTAHTTNPVPLILVGRDDKLRDGRLCDLCPTLLKLMGMKQPREMTGVSLV